MSVFHSCIIVIPMKKSDYALLLLLLLLAVQYQYLVHGSSSGPYPGSKGCVCTCKRHTERYMFVLLFTASSLTIPK